MPEANIEVLYYAVGAPPQKISIENSLDALMKLVGGYIEHINLFDNVCIICNEEGRVNNLPPNRLWLSKEGVPLDLIRGDFLVLVTDAGWVMSLTHPQIERVMDCLQELKAIIVQK